MPYPGQFIRLVIIGTIYEDIVNTTLSIVPSALGEFGMLAPDQATLEAVADDVGDWWRGDLTPGNPGFTLWGSLTGIKLNRIGVDGRYTEPETMEYFYPTPINGTASNTPAAQNSMVATLRTAVPRGRGSKGRMYLPPTSAVSDVRSDGRILPATALGQAIAVKALIDRLNATYVGIGRVGVASNAGAGRFEHVTHVSVGRVVDTVRSRRSALDEDYQTVAI
jgi:hypothetical protein